MYEQIKQKIADLSLELDAESSCNLRENKHD